MFAGGKRGSGGPKEQRSVDRRDWKVRASAGFTVLEILIVVVIVTLLAAIAVPGISKRARGYKARGIAETAANIYRGARLNALGRGAATLVRYDQVTGTLTVLEAIQGPVVAAAQGAGCATMPVNSCTDNLARWDPASVTNQRLSTTNLLGGGDFTTTMLFRDAAGNSTASATIDVCFTPAGRTFVRGGAAPAALGGTPFGTMAGSARLDIVEPDGAVADGTLRYVAIPPSGAARTVRAQ